MVFDGFDLHAKKDTKKKREEKRARYIKKRDLAKAEGRKDDYIKFKNYSMTIQKRHIVLLMDYLTFAGVEFVVSPYEADAQLAYMHKIGQIDYVVTEDSDLVLYDCGNIINKLNQSGYCELLQVKNESLLYNNSDTEEVEDFIKLSQEQRIWMSLMVGCDYLEKVRGVGLKKGIDLIQNVTSLKSLFAKLKERCKRFNNTSSYKTAFKNCELVFKFQKVYNPLTQKLCYFQKPDEHMLKYMKTISNLEDFVGSQISNLSQHILGENIRKQVPESERLLFDFESLEYKVHHRKYQYQMNQISNLVSYDPNNAILSKNDLETHIIEKDKFYEQNKTKVSLLKKLPKEIKRGRQGKRYAREMHVKTPRNKVRVSRRSRSNDLPSDEICPVLVDSLKNEYKEKNEKKHQKKMATRSKKWRNIDVVEKNKNMLQEILEASLNPVVNSNNSITSKKKTKLNNPTNMGKSKQKGLSRLQRKSRKNLPKKMNPKFKSKKMESDSKIIRVGDLLEAEERKEKNQNLFINIGYHMPHLKNDEQSKINARNNKIFYRRDISVRRKKTKKSKISKFSQNIMGSDVSVEEFVFSSSEDETQPIIAKRISKRRKKRDTVKKRIKAD